MLNQIILLLVLATQVQSIGLLLKNIHTQYCFYVTPRYYDSKITVQYTVTGINEDQIEFTAKQGKEILYEVSGERELEKSLHNKDKEDVQFCWMKTDRKPKRLNWMIT